MGQGLSIAAVRTRHAELCYGAVVAVNEEPVLGWTVRQLVRPCGAWPCSTPHPFVAGPLAAVVESALFELFEHMSTAIEECQQLFAFAFICGLCRH